MSCPNCGATADSTAAFCPNCGTSLTSGSASSQTRTDWRNPFPSASPGAAYSIAAPEDRGRRILGYLIDLVPMLLLSLLHFIPIIGWMLYGLIHACYWLLRDINGASLGKLVLNSYVANIDGSPATTSQRVMRNVLLAIPGVFGMIPLVGIAFEIILALIIFGGEGLILILTGRRLGDRLANTTVFRR